MSLYDIAVQKLGFPTIELFVKVGLWPCVLRRQRQER